MTRSALSARTFFLTLVLSVFLTVPPSMAEEESIDLVIARFQGPDPNMYPVEDVFRMWLEYIYGDFDWIEFSSISESIPFDDVDPFTGDSAGIAIGRENGADLLIWGAYKVKDDGTMPSFLAYQLPMFLELPLESSMAYVMFTDEMAFSQEDFLDPGPPSDLFSFHAYMILSDYYLISDPVASLEYTDLAGQYLHAVDGHDVSSYHLNRAASLFLSERLQEAYDEIELAIESSPYESDVLYGMRTDIEMAMSEAGIVIPSLQSQDGIPATVEQCYQLAVTYDQAGRYDDALVLYDAAIEKATDDEMLASLFLDRALCNSLRNDYDAALEDAMTAIEYDPRNPMAHIRMGEMLVDLNNYGDALPYFDSALGLAEEGSYEHLYSLQARGLTHLELGEFQLGVDDLNEIINTSFFNPFVSERYGVALKYMGHNQQSIDFITAAIEAGRESGNGYANRAYAYYDLGNLEQAIGDLGSALTLEENPDNIGVIYFDRAAMELEVGDYESAIEDLDKCLDMFPDYADGHYQRGYIYALVGRLDEALEDMETCLQLPEESFSHEEIVQSIDEIRAAMQ